MSKWRTNQQKAVRKQQQKEAGLPEWLREKPCHECGEPFGMHKLGCKTGQILISDQYPGSA